MFCEKLKNKNNNKKNALGEVQSCCSHLCDSEGLSGEQSKGHQDAVLLRGGSLIPLCSDPQPETLPVLTTPPPA